ncbi:lanthionine synthetase LanC family protein [Nocardioides acrostichi]|uniref:Lanthionine synthetase C family protein n=1 Tax=Nocardioides acrostichi TaxID=2784339 RepID=A0A930UWY8_9ACTN|nr:lanthionine synthetase LanC family protein [Nocardioides acrostichi]MBF4160600.1 lanthionine synthetase C family protein [Nocardioides acrostichi]
MVIADRAARAARAEGANRLARSAVDWLLNGHAADSEDPSLYHGQAGVALALHDAAEHFGDARYAHAAAAVGDALAARVESLEDCSLYFGLAGVAGSLRSLGRDEAADRALSRIQDRFDGERWNEMFELLVGNAGIGLGALWSGEVNLAVMAVTPYLAKADRTAHGVNWPVQPSPPRSHHIAHGTLGIVYSLAAVGQAAAREDLIELALAGAADVVRRNEADPEGFLVAHSDPPHRPELIERYSLGWCNGPAGDAQVFRQLAWVTGDSIWVDLADRCWRTITRSGLPTRTRPGFWDNNGRCCGTAGVLALACDRIVERGDDFHFADVLVDDLRARATIDEAGARWSNYEYRASPSELEPLAGWAMGNAGIVRELLRYARLNDGGFDGYAVQWPDHPGALAAMPLEQPG